MSADLDENDALRLFQRTLVLKPCKEEDLSNKQKSKLKELMLSALAHNQDNAPLTVCEKQHTQTNKATQSNSSNDDHGASDFKDGLTSETSVSSIDESQKPKTKRRKTSGKLKKDSQLKPKNDTTNSRAKEKYDFQKEVSELDHGSILSGRPKRLAAQQAISRFGAYSRSSELDDSDENGADDKEEESSNDESGKPISHKKRAFVSINKQKDRGDDRLELNRERKDTSSQKKLKTDIKQQLKEKNLQKKNRYQFSSSSDDSYDGSDVMGVNSNTFSHHTNSPKRMQRTDHDIHGEFESDEGNEQNDDDSDDTVEEDKFNDDENFLDDE